MLAVGSLAWGLAPWLPDGGVLVLVGAVCWTWSTRRSWRSGAVMVAASVALQLSWLPTPWRDAELAGPWGAWLVASLLQALPGLFAVAVFRRLQGRGVVLASTVGWMVAEGLAATLQPVPANHALLLADHPVWLWPAAWGGRVGLTGLAAGWSALLITRPRWAALVLVGWLAGGLWPSSPRKDIVDVVVVQPDVHVIDARVASQHDALREAARATLAGVDDGTWLTVWPEGGYPGDPGEVAGTRRDRFLATVDSNGPVLIGASIGRRAPRTNSLLLVDDGVVAGRIDKQVLVPFWERPVAGWGVRRFVARGGASVVQVRGRPVGGLVCYEDLFEHRLRDVAAADLLVLASNDSWLGTVGRRVHLASARLAAVTTNRAVLRPTLDGLSAVVQPDGSSTILTAGPRWPKSRGRVLQARVPLGGPGRPGVHVSRWLAVLAWLVVVVWGRR